MPTSSSHPQKWCSGRKAGPLQLFFSSPSSTHTYTDIHLPGSSKPQLDRTFATGSKPRLLALQSKLPSKESCRFQQPKNQPPGMVAPLGKLWYFSGRGASPDTPSLAWYSQEAGTWINLPLDKLYLFFFFLCPSQSGIFWEAERKSKLSKMMNICYLSLFQASALFHWGEKGRDVWLGPFQVPFADSRVISRAAYGTGYWQQQSPSWTHTLNSSLIYMQTKQQHYCSAGGIFNCWMFCRCLAGCIDKGILSCWLITAHLSSFNIKIPTFFDGCGIFKTEILC